MFDGPIAPRSPAAGLDLVDDHQRALPIAERSQAREEIRRRDHHSTIALDRLQYYRRQRLPLGGGEILQRLHGQISGRRAVAERVGKVNEGSASRNSQRLAVAGLAGESHGTNGASEITAGETHDCAFGPPGSREQQRHLVGHGAGDCWQQAIEARWRDAGECFVKLGSDPGRVGRRTMHQRRRLTLDRLDDSGMAIAHRGDGEAPIKIEIPSAVGVFDMAALGVLPDEGRILGECPEPAALELTQAVDDVACAAHTRILPFSAMTSPSTSMRTFRIMPSRWTSLMTLPP